MYILTDKREKILKSKRTGKPFVYSSERLALLAAEVFSNHRRNKKTGKRPEYYVWEASDFFKTEVDSD